MTDAARYARDCLQIAVEDALRAASIPNPPYNVRAHVADGACHITYSIGEDHLVASGTTAAEAVAMFATALQVQDHAGATSPPHAG